jgi:hypothetical protein
MEAIRTSDLKLRIGAVGTGAISAGSTSLDCFLSWTAEDIGSPVTVFGADATGKWMLITTVTAVADGSHCTLADAAVTDVAFIGSPNVTVYREVQALTGTIKWTGSIVSRGALDFTIDSAPADRPVVGNPVLLTLVTAGVEDIAEPIFGGSIETAQPSNVPGSGIVRTPCGCINWMSLLSKRSTGLRTYEGTHASPAVVWNCGDIITDLNIHTLGDDFLKVDVQPGVDIDSITFDHIMNAEAIGQLVRQSNNETDTYFLWVSPWRVIHFELQTTVAAPWGIDDTTGTDENVLIQVSATIDRSKLANRVIVRATQQIASASAPESYPGDGVSRTFNLLYVVSTAPTVTVNGTPKTVGVLGVDSGKDWYWSVGSNSIEQDAGGTILISTDTFTATYDTYAIGIAAYNYNVSVDARAAVESGTGRYETVIWVTTPTTQAQMNALAESVAKKFGSLVTSVGVATLKPGLMPGQLFPVTLSDIGVSGEFLIDSVTLTTSDNVCLWSVTAIGSPLIGDWRKAFADLARDDWAVPVSGQFAPTCFLSRKPGDGEILYDFIPAVPCAFPPDLTGSTVRVETNPTATAVYSFRKGVLASGVYTYSEFGTLSISTGGVGSWTSASGASFNGTTDALRKVAPASQDATLAGVGTCLRGAR